MHFLLHFFTGLNRLLWGRGLLLLLLGTGAVCLVCHKAACLQSFGLLFRKRHRTGLPDACHALSPFRACMTSLAASMGTGNIAGVATALTLGGAGAVFWMWTAAFLGMGLLYAENVLGCHYRTENCSGAVAYLRYGLGCPWLAKGFAVCCVGASFGMGNMTQSHAIAQSLQVSFSVPVLYTGIITAALLACVIFGGVKRISSVTSVLIPVLSGVYLLLAGWILWKYHDRLGLAVRCIFQEATGWQAVGGGIGGAAVRQAVSVGVRRGVFSNEAGLGSSSLLHGEAAGSQPAFLGLCAMLEVIADTFICCTATALVILCTGVMDTGADGAGLVLLAFRAGIGKAADWLLPFMIALFAFCTLIGWSYCGASACKALCRQENQEKCIFRYRLCFCVCVALGAVMQSELVWTLADICNACMAYCNLPAVLFLYPGFHRQTRKNPL